MPSTPAWWGALMGAAIIASAPMNCRAAELLLSPAEALRRAQENSPDVQAAQAALDAARGRASQAGLGPNPEARLDVENIQGSGPYRSSQAAETTLGVAQALELGGKRRTRVEAARAEVRAAEIRVAIARADLIRDVGERYAEAWAAQERLRLADEAVQRADDLARATQLLVDVGREPPLRALRAKTVAVEARAEASAATAALVAARSALAALWNDTQSSFALTLPETLNQPAGHGGAVDTLDVRLAEAELASARAAVERERSLATPNVTVEAGIRRFSDTDDHAFVLHLAAPIPLRDRNQGATAAARAEAVTAEVRRNQALAAATRGQRDARAALSAAEAQLAAAGSTSVPDAERALKLARLGYQAGKFSLLDVLDAEAALATARNSLVQAQLSRAKAQAALARALAQ